MADAADGGNDWELVSLTTSAYAAAPGPISPPPPPLLQVDPAATSEQSPPSPPPPAATFMSQHFNLPAEEAPAGLLNGGRLESESTTPATLSLDHGLGIPCPEKNSCCETEALDCNNQPTGSSDSFIPWDDTERKISPSATLDDAGSDRTRSASPPHSHVSVAATDDGIAVGSTEACLPAPAAAPPRVPCEAWWKKTFSFLRGNARESLTFRFVFVADKLQLRLEFGVDGQKISFPASETLGQVKVSMLGGSPVCK